MNSNINEVTKSIGKKVVVITKNLDEIRELLKELKITREPIQGQGVPENNLQASDDQYIYNENYNSEFKNVGTESDVESDAGSGADADADAGSGADADAGFGANAKSNVTNVPTLALPKKFDVRIEYTPIQIQNYHDLASNEATTGELNPEKKYNIIINAEKRHDYLKRNKTSDEQEEFQKLDEIFEKCKKNGFCQKIKDNWMSIKDRRSLNSTGSPSTYRSNSSQSTPRSQVIEAWKGGIKTRKRKHRTTKRRRTNKKSHSHKKRH
jgi:hypothetical protein